MHRPSAPMLILASFSLALAAAASDAEPVKLSVGIGTSKDNAGTVVASSDVVLHLRLDDDTTNEDTDFWVLFGPNSADEQAQPSEVSLEKAEGAAPNGTNPGFTMALRRNWIYLVGRYPVARTNRVSSAADGTIMLLQIFNDGEKELHRVFFLNPQPGERIRIVKADDPDEKLMCLRAFDAAGCEDFTLRPSVTTDCYVEIDENGIPGQPINVPCPGDKGVGDFVAYVRSRLAAANLPVPPDPCDQLPKP